MRSAPEPWNLPVPPPDASAAEQAAARQLRLTKPPGSLGALEEIAIRLAALQATGHPRSTPRSALLFAADHPVCVHGVSAYPQEVTAAMVAGFVRGGTAASILAAELAVPLTVVDVGVAGGPVRLPRGTGGAHHRRAPVADMPAGDLRAGEAMTPAVFSAAVEAGRAAVDALTPAPRLLALGEMGIGNTTAASAVSAVVLGEHPHALVGRGTGADAPTLERKRAVVRDAVRHAGRVPPMEALRRVGGRDMAALVGAASRAVQRRIPVLVDGFIVTAALLAWVRAVPAALPWLLFAHRSGEPGHARLLQALDAEPLLDLGMRLGEGSGALTALPLIDLACALHRGMATFDEAGVPGARPRG